MPDQKSAFSMALERLEKTEAERRMLESRLRDQKSAYRIVRERLKQTDDERQMLISSFLTVSDWQLAHNKGMRKAYSTIREDLEAQGLVDNEKDESI